MPWGTKNMPPKKILSRGSLSNWCDVDADADADADISKTICRPPPYGGGRHNFTTAGFILTRTSNVFSSNDNVCKIKEMQKRFLKIFTSLEATPPPTYSLCT